MLCKILASKNGFYLAARKVATYIGILHFLRFLLWGFVINPCQFLFCSSYFDYIYMCILFIGGMI